MRVVLLAVVAFLITTTVHAQGFSAGARSGIGLWKGEVYNEWTFSNEVQGQTLWEKEVFLRYETKGHLAFELGVNQVETDYKGVVYGLCGTGLPANYSYISDRSIIEKYYGINLRVQYGLSCPHVPRLRNYPGIAISPTIRVMEDEASLRNVSTAGVSDGGKITTTTNDLKMQLGFEDVIRYQLSKHVDIHSLITYKYIVGGNVLQRAFAFQAGLAYRF